jgi:hypothetical protein
MRKISYLMLLCAMGWFGVASTQAADTAAQPAAKPGVVTDPSVARIAYLEDKVANLESTVQTDKKACDSCCEETCENVCGPRLCGNPGLIGGYDFLWLKPHFSNAVSYSVFEDFGVDTLESYYGYPTEYEFAPRFWFGYQGYNGLGVRLRYTQFDHCLGENTLVTDAATIVSFDGLDATDGETMTFCSGMEMHVFDVEFTKNFDVACAQITAGAGLRYGKVMFNATGAVINVADVTTDVVALENTFEGVGPTVFVDFKAPIRSSRLSIIGGLRGSVLFGRRYTLEDYTDLVAPVTTATELWRDNRTTSMIDASFGLQYDRCLTNGVDGFVRMTWEGQTWNDVGSPTTSDGDMSMQGLCIAFGILR